LFQNGRALTMDSKPNRCDVRGNKLTFDNTDLTPIKLSIKNQDIVTIMVLNDFYLQSLAMPAYTIGCRLHTYFYGAIKIVNSSQ
jgi:hypothetical protein